MFVEKTIPCEREKIRPIIRREIKNRNWIQFVDDEDNDIVDEVNFGGYYLEDL